MQNFTCLPNRTCSGFTLIELSIVLVVIGLMAGGILVGRDLIHAAELRTILSQRDAIDAAIITFEARYDCFPGDCRSATNFFAGSPNGNGNGFLNSYYESNDESFYFWCHLAAANLQSGSFTCTSNSGATNNAIVGINVPATKMNGIGVYFGYWPGGSVDAVAYIQPKKHTHLMQFGRSGYGPFYPENSPNGLALFGDNAFTAPDLFWVDTKLDDGIANTGTVQDTSNQVRLCSSGSPTYGPWGVGPNYNLTSQEKHCVLGFFEL